MKKLIYILIIPFFISCYQETNLDFLFNGSIDPSDSTLIDSITGVSDPNYKLTDVDFDITLGYLPGKTAAKLNGQPICTFYQNANYADTLFTQWLDQELNADLTENKPFRIQRIAHYSTPTPDVNDYFQTPPKATSLFREVGVGKPYSTIDAAIAATSNGWIIYVYDGIYQENNTTLKNLNMYRDHQIIGVGNCEVRASAGANAVVSAFTSTGYKSIEGFYINAEDTYARCAYNLTKQNIKRCYLADPTNIHIQVNSVGKDTVINSAFVGGAGTATIYGHNIYASENYFNTAASQMLYSITSSGTREILYNDFYINHAFTYIERNTFSGNYDTKYNNYINNIACTNNILFGSANSGIIDYSGNYFEFNFAIGTPYVFQSGGGFTGQYSANTFKYNDQGDNSRSLLIRDQSDISIIGNTFLSAIDANHAYIYYNATTATLQSNVTISNNYFKVANTTGYAIRVGEETTGVGNNTIEPVIEGNHVEGYGRGSNLFHSVLIGFQNNPTIRYNKFDSTGYGMVLKATTGDYSTENIGANRFNNCFNAFRIKGVSNAFVYNSTIDSCEIGFFISDNEGAGTGANQTLENNIISNSDDLITISTGGAITTSNYNILFNGSLDGGNYATWQGLGYDANSFNTDPNFKSSTELWVVSPSDAIGNALNLGTPYDTALNISSVWPDSIVNKQQFARWSMGAYIPPFETIDNYVADTLMSIWADKMNQTIKIFLNSNDTIELETP